MEARASTPRHARRGPSPLRQGERTILPRGMQEQVFQRLFDTWTREDGKEYVDKVKTNFPACTEAQERKKLMGYFKTHADYTYGGQLWLKFLIAVGAVPPEAVRAANIVVECRVQFKQHQWPTEEAQPPTGARFLGRSARASTPGPVSEEQPRKMRRRAQKYRRQLEQEKRDAGRWWEDRERAENFERRAAEIAELMDEADEAALRSGFPHKDRHGIWRNVNPDSSRSLFEEALRLYLKKIGCNDAEVDTITAKPVLRRPAGRGGSGGHGWQWDGGGHGGGRRGGGLYSGGYYYGGGGSGAGSSGLRR